MSTGYVLCSNIIVRSTKSGMGRGGFAYEAIILE